MSNTRYSKRQVSGARQKRQINKETNRVREFVADLPFNEIVLLQQIWERQQRDVPSKRRAHYKN